MGKEIEKERLGNMISQYGEFECDKVGREIRGKLLE